MDDLLRRLEGALLEVFEDGSAEPAETHGVFQEALLAVTSRQREIENPAGVVGMDRLRRLKYWHDRRQAVCEAVDRILLQSLDAPTAGSASPRTPSQLGELIDQLAPRCRSLLRLRYGLDVASDPITAKLSERKAGIRKTTARCLTSLARALVERGLAMRSPSNRG